MSEREQGSVKWFSKNKGYGFIQRENGSDIFVHYSNINIEGFKVLEDGQAVEFGVGSNEKGEYAEDVQVV
jgi:CspA family cold shock protein